MILFSVCLILSPFSGGKTVSSTGYCFSTISSFDLVTASATLFPKTLPALWTTFWKHLALYPIIVSYIFLIKIHIL